ncbi:MAG: cytidylate kinase-like family protein [Chloroflexota bacterium]|nr:cytidylate kinase-like family protein [Dehalococcoidia bacterium]MDW8047709.1 cytidylate kinase-like family protein [Chloroflexota bacterium]
MNVRVVTIARQVGTAGEEVARFVAERLHFRYVDYQVVQQAAREAGVSPDTVSEAEHTPSLLTRFLEALARTPSAPAAAWADPVPLATSPLFTSTDYRQFIEQAIRDLAQEGNCVIVGHAAQVILRKRPDTLKVLVTGSPEVRARRIMAGMGVDEKEALKTVERTDRERLDYFERFYNTGWLDPWTYDLTVSTDQFTPSQAADVICAAARAR